MRKLLAVCIAATAALACAEDRGITVVQDAPDLDLAISAMSGGPQGRLYEVTIDNLTTSQPFSPGVLVTHSRGTNVWEAGESASEGIRFIAENGDPSTAVAELTGASGIHQVVATGAPIHRIGGPGPTSLSMEIASRGSARRLSVSVMLICTNDGFVGLDGVKLPGGFSPSMWYANAYDAGTELNDEMFTSIVDPCGGIGPVAAEPDGQNNRTATTDPIAAHPGVAGGSDLDPDLHGWDDPVAKVTVQRLSLKFGAMLAGDNEVPPVATQAHGRARFHRSVDGTELWYALSISHMEGVVQAHIHIGPPDQNGPVAAFLFGPNAGASVEGILAMGSITEADLIPNSAYDGTMAGLLQNLRDGTAYVNVHTLVNPGGEIRGQIEGVSGN